LFQQKYLAAEDDSPNDGSRFGNPDFVGFFIAVGEVRIPDIFIIHSSFHDCLLQSHFNDVFVYVTATILW